MIRFIFWVNFLGNFVQVRMFVVEIVLEFVMVVIDVMFFFCFDCVFVCELFVFVRLFWDQFRFGVVIYLVVVMDFSVFVFWGDYGFIIRFFGGNLLFVDYMVNDVF